MPNQYGTVLTDLHGFGSGSETLEPVIHSTVKSPDFYVGSTVTPVSVNGTITLIPGLLSY